MSRVVWLSPEQGMDSFPPVHDALESPNGLLAAGGDLSVARLTCAYRHGIFPWYDEGQPILWWSPDPRAVLFPQDLSVSRSLRKTLRKGIFDVTFDKDFAAVVAGCAGERRGQPGTWIDESMTRAYLRLHRHGHAHSVETWQDGTLAGGLYGVTIGRVFFGESMFSRATDASKVALVRLVEALVDWGYRLVDCQLPSPHLASLGSREIRRQEFVGLLDTLTAESPEPDAWQVV